jgi:hypothetical protein
VTATVGIDGRAIPEIRRFVIADAVEQLRNDADSQLGSRTVSPCPRKGQSVSLRGLQGVAAVREPRPDRRDETPRRGPAAEMEAAPVRGRGPTHAGPLADRRLVRAARHDRLVAVTGMWSWLLMAVGVTGMWVAGRRPKVGWLIGLSAQGLWVAYAVATSQLGFLVSAFVYGFTYWSNWVARGAVSGRRPPVAVILPDRQLRARKTAAPRRPGRRSVPPCPARLGSWSAYYPGAAKEQSERGNWSLRADVRLWPLNPGDELTDGASRVGRAVRAQAGRPRPPRRRLHRRHRHRRPTRGCRPWPARSSLPCPASTRSSRRCASPPSRTPPRRSPAAPGRTAPPLKMWQTMEDSRSAHAREGEQAEGPREPAVPGQVDGLGHPAPGRRRVDVHAVPRTRRPGPSPTW